MVKRESSARTRRVPVLGALVLASCASVLGIEDVYEGPVSPNAGASNDTAGVAGSVTGGSPGAGGSAGSVGGSGRAGAGPGGSPIGGKAGAGAPNVSGGEGGDGQTANGGATGGSTPIAGRPNTGGAPGGTGGTASSGCDVQQTRCTESGRETCDANAEWVSTPCPANTPTCKDGACVVRGPTMVKVSSFYVDSTEVTVAHYREFLTDKDGDTSGQPAVCEWNTAYDDNSVPQYPDAYPRTYVDWCDAMAFCTWAGKRLCGRIGGGPATRDELYETANGQWYLACGGPQGASHPRLNAVCNYSNSLADVASYPECEGYYPGLFDMEGNAREWVDSCDGTTGASDTCRLIGSSAVDDEGYCDIVPAEYARNYKAMPFGFRCCAE